MFKRYIIILAILSLLVSACKPLVNCGTDLECFQQNSVDCSRTRVNIIDEQGDNFRVTVRGFRHDSCQISLRVEKVGEQLRRDYPRESLIAIGKTMTCDLDKRFAKENISFHINKIFELEEEFNRSCSGPIKDLLQGPFKEKIKEKLIS